MVELKQVTAVRGLSWIAQAFRLLRTRPLMWLALNTLLLFLALAFTLVGSLIPLLGSFTPLVIALLTPVFMAGQMLACRDAERGGQIQFAHLFRGFKQDTSALITVGGVYLVGQLVIAGVMFFLAGSEFRGMIAGETDAAMPVSTSTDRLMFALLVSCVLFVPLLMAIWFAPPLIVMDGLPAVAAMRTSMRACLLNLIPMLVNGLGLIAVLVATGFVLRFALSVLPPGFNFLRNAAAIAAFVTWITLVVISVYAAYRELFARTAVAQTQA